MALTTTANAKERMRVSGSGDDTLIGNLVTRAQAMIEDYCDRLFDEATYREWYSGSRGMSVCLRNYPVTTVKRLAYGSATALTVEATTSTDLRATVEVQDDGVYLSRFASTGTETATTVDFATYPTASDIVTQINTVSGWSATIGTNALGLDLHRLGGSDATGNGVELTFPDQSDLTYRVDQDAGLLHLTHVNEWPDPGDTGWTMPSGCLNVLVHYTAGYATAPAGLEAICLDVVEAMYRKTSHDSTVGSKRLGDYSVSLMSPAEFATSFGWALDTKWRNRRN